jgi:NAD(P)-dependent dehydrogenase (short-subunit alcohol dehydrogenase family)
MARTNIFEGKTAIITGGASGMGKAVAKSLAHRGFRRDGEIA